MKTEKRKVVAKLVTMERSTFVDKRTGNILPEVKVRIELADGSTIPVVVPKGGDSFAIEETNVKFFPEGILNTLRRVSPLVNRTDIADCDFCSMLKGATIKFEVYHYTADDVYVNADGNKINFAGDAFRYSPINVVLRDSLQAIAGDEQANEARLIALIKGA